MAVAYEELGGSPEYEFTSTGASCRRVFRVSAANLAAFQLELMGGSIGDRGVSHPQFSTLRVQSIDTKPDTGLAAADCPRNSVATDATNVYPYYRVEATYQARAVMDESADDTIKVLTGDEIELEYSVSSGNEMIQIPASALFWDASLETPAHQQTTIGIRVPVIRHTYRYGNVKRSDIPFVKLQDYVGTVNSHSMYLNGYPYTPEQVLFDGYTLNANAPAPILADSRWTLEYHFLTKNHVVTMQRPTFSSSTSSSGVIEIDSKANWNKFLNSNDGGVNLQYVYFNYRLREGVNVRFRPFGRENLAELAVSP